LVFLNGDFHMLVKLGRPHKCVSAAAPSAYLGAIIPSTVVDLDATIAASYPGTGTTWANLAAAPADGAAQTAYDFFLGDGSTGTTYPTFTGTAGNAAAYFSLDSSDYFALKSGTNTTFLKNLHKSTGGQKATIILAMRTGSSGYYCGTAPSSVNGSNHGFYFYKSGSSLYLDQFSATTYGRTSTTVTGNGTDMLVAIAFDVTAGTIKKASNTRTFTNVVGPSFIASTADATLSMKIGANGAAATTGGTCRIYGCYMFNDILNDTQLGAVVDEINARHGRTYA
jgi:hypothetical protein